MGTSKLLADGTRTVMKYELYICTPGRIHFVPFSGVQSAKYRMKNSGMLAGGVGKGRGPWPLQQQRILEGTKPVKRCTKCMK